MGYPSRADYLRMLHPVKNYVLNVLLGIGVVLFLAVTFALLACVFWVVGLFWPGHYGFVDTTGMGFVIVCGLAVFGTAIHALEEVGSDFR